ncbi:uncharacterized protein LOC136089219 [Hydra vulgaris]|uniref:Uncharacterized protein LOC136089219 n=1 Tax=Hydra vulgaris TaxID=6087 RepID=A0ABM4D9M9_HYDVU
MVWGQTLRLKMVKGCCVFDCSTNVKSHRNLSFYILPADSKRRRLWLNAIYRIDSSCKNKLWSPNTKHVYVSSKHFVSGKKENFEKHIDYVPSVSMLGVKKSIVESSHRQNRLLSQNERRINRLNSSLEYRVQKSLDNNSQVDEVSEQINTDDALTGVEDVSVLNQHETTTEFSEGIDFNLISEEIDSPKQSAKINSTTSIENPERDAIYIEMNNLREETYNLRLEVSDLKLKPSSPFSYANISMYKEKCVTLTGLEFDVLEKLLPYLIAKVSDGRNSKEEMYNQIMVCIIKLRHNYTFEMIAFICNIAKQIAINYFWKWIDIMYLKLSCLIKMQKRDHLFDTIPAVFKAKFPRLTSIIDCFEIFVESPSSLMSRAQLYSQYKKHCTIKVFISCWGGRTSDVHIVRESQFHTLKYHMPGDQILADRGFILKEDFAVGSSTELITPAFTRGKSQLSAKEVEDSRKISSVRIHIERVIGLMKNRFTILKGIIPLRTIRSIKDEAVSADLASFDKIVTVCAALTNLGESIVSKPPSE